MKLTLVVGALFTLVACGDDPAWIGTYASTGSWDISGPLAGNRTVGDAVADLLYVTYGTAVSCGIDIEPIFREVHRSNMTKVGGTRRDDGKWIKPDDYSPAQIEPLLKQQQSAAPADCL